MTSKNETGFFIKYKGNATYELTQPERKVKAILKEQGLGYRLQEPITITDEETGKLAKVVVIGFSSLHRKPTRNSTSQTMHNMTRFK